VNGVLDIVNTKIFVASWKASLLFLKIIERNLCFHKNQSIEEFGFSPHEGFE